MYTKAITETTNPTYVDTRSGAVVKLVMPETFRANEKLMTEKVVATIL